MYITYILEGFPCWVVNTKVYDLGLGLLMLFQYFCQMYPPSTFFHALLMTICFTEINMF